MATHMIVADLKLVSQDQPNVQKVAVLNKPFDISVKYAEIPEAGDSEVRVKDQMGWSLRVRY